MIKGVAKGSWEGVIRQHQRRPLGPQDAEIELRGETGDLQSVGRRGVAVRLRDAMDEAFASEPAEVVGHLRVLILSTNRSSIGANKAGEGMGCPRWSRRK